MRCTIAANQSRDLPFHPIRPLLYRQLLLPSQPHFLSRDLHYPNRMFHLTQQITKTTNNNEKQRRTVISIIVNATAYAIT
jgi:hypothetical protein